MDARDLLTDSFERVKETVHGIAEGLDGAALNYRPDADANSIGWLIWHLTRVEDDHVADLARIPQAYVVEGWADRLGLRAEESDIGYGHTTEQVAAVRFDSPDEVLAYQDRVHERTLEYIATIDAAELERIVDTRWDPPVTAAVRIVSVINDCTQHMGQAAYVKGLWERLER